MVSNRRRQEESGVPDAIQRLAHRRYGHRRIAVWLRREGLAVNPKRVLRLMREDALLWGHSAATQTARITTCPRFLCLTARVQSTNHC
jgi:hypothetical protein